MQALFRRGQLKALVDLHSETEGLGGQLAAEEINVIRGALDLTNKTAAKGMTPLDKVSSHPSDITRFSCQQPQIALGRGYSQCRMAKPFAVFRPLFSVPAARKLEQHCLPRTASLRCLQSVSDQVRNWDGLEQVA